MGGGLLGFKMDWLARKQENRQMNSVCYGQYVEQILESLPNGKIFFVIEVKHILTI